jgi:molecular chaperone Hsp33
LPEGHGDPDGWNRSRALFATLSDAELAGLPGRELVWRLFHEEEPQWLSDQDLAFACSCSRERVADMLRGLGRDEALAAAADAGQAEIHCDFCGQAYIFNRYQLEDLFSPGTEVPGPTSLQ